MKTHEHPQKPTMDELRAARIAGAKASIRHFSSSKQDRLLKAYQVLDTRREEVITAFIKRIKD
jgi:hypothetical protein